MTASNTTLQVQTDRELLELAAQAAGLGIESHNERGSAWAFRLAEVPNEDGERDIFVWNPWSDYGDALRLAVDLRIDITFVCSTVECCLMDGKRKTWFSEEPINDAQDQGEATRRAIVRAAAALASTPVLEKAP